MRGQVVPGGVQPEGRAGETFGGDVAVAAQAGADLEGDWGLAFRIGPDPEPGGQVDAARTAIVSCSQVRAESPSSSWKSTRPAKAARERRWLSVSR